ncbi:hypothetical protein JCM8202_005576 [Rhodotorula sphaerocarpa]
MSNIEHTIRKNIPKSRKDIKVDRTHAFHGVIMVLGWVAPPVAVLVRFGVGWDLFLNIILTVGGYIPGHAHNFFIQNIRNNKNHKRTPKWAIRAGLVHIKDPRAGRHQWANRYDQGVTSAPSDGDSIRSNSWDGRGAEPNRSARRPGGKSHSHRFHLSPWDDTVGDSEAEDGVDAVDRFDPPSRTSTLASRRDEGPTPDPLNNEQFYSGPEQPPPPVVPSKKKTFGSGLLKNRSRYEQPFDTSDAVSSRTRGSDGFQDDFEREINGGRSAAGGGGRGGSAGRFDAFEDEGPEEAWSSAPQRSNGYSAGGNGAVPPLHPQRTGRAEDGDGDLFNHTF